MMAKTAQLKSVQGSSTYSLRWAINARSRVVSFWLLVTKLLVNRCPSSCTFVICALLPLFVTAYGCDSREPLRYGKVARADAHVMRAFRANEQVVLEVGSVEHRFAGGTFDPQALGHGRFFHARRALDAWGQ